MFVRYITAGPAAIRTAPRSFVSRAITSPVRVRPYQAVSSAARRAKQASRRSVSTTRETALRMFRIWNRNTAITSVTAIIRPPIRRTAPIPAFASSASSAWRRSVGMTLYIAVEMTTQASPAANRQR